MNTPIETPALVIPAGVRIASTSDGMTIEHQGDIVIHGSLSLPLKSLLSHEGSVRVTAQEPLAISRLEAPQAEVSLAGPITVSTVRARRILFQEGQLAAGALVASESISLLGAALKADFVVAPQVDTHPQLRGRATVIESNQELGPNRLTGAFRLDDWQELMPNAAAALEPYPEVKEQIAAQRASVESSADTPSETSAPAPQLTLVPSPPETVLPEILPAPGEANTADGDIEELIPDPMEEIYSKLSDSYLKITMCYPDAPHPPPLKQLDSLIESRRFQELKAQINGLWNELLIYHKREGLHLANGVQNNIREMKQILQDKL